MNFVDFIFRQYYNGNNLIDRGKGDMKNIFDLTGKRALVTGSTQGIGYAIAKALHENGAEVYIHCSSDDCKAKQVAAEIGSNLFVTGDFSKEDAVRNIFKATGDLDIVVANVSVQIRRHWTEISTSDFDTQININLRSTLQLMQSYIPPMQKKKWGRFLVVGSVAQYRPHPDMSIYAASKCALQSLVFNIAKQVAKDGVTVNDLLPGVIDTPRNDSVLQDESYRQKVLSGIPMGSIGTPDDCIGAALLLCSDAARYITGAELLVDGGMRL